MNQRNMSRKTNRIGECNENSLGLTMQIVRYRNNKDVTIKIIETGEMRKTTYYNFKKGKVGANLMKYPPGIGCTLKQASFILAGCVFTFLSAIVALIYLFVK